MTKSSVPPPVALATELETLRTELAELGFALDRRGQAEAADVAVWAAGRLATIRSAWSEHPDPMFGPRSIAR